MISESDVNTNDIEVTFDPNISMESSDLETASDTASNEIPCESKVSSKPSCA